MVPRRKTSELSFCLSDPARFKECPSTDFVLGGIYILEYLVVNKPLNKMGKFMIMGSPKNPHDHSLLMVMLKTNQETT